MLTKFYTYRRYSYAFAVFCIIAGFIISYKLSSDTRNAVKQRMSILPCPVRTEDPSALKQIELTPEKGGIRAANKGKGTIYMLELDTGSSESLIWTGTPVKPGEAVLIKTAAGRARLLSAGVSE